MPLFGGIAAAVQGCASNPVCTAVVASGVQYAISKAQAKADERGPDESEFVRQVGSATQTFVDEWATRGRD